MDTKQFLQWKKVQHKFDSLDESRLKSSRNLFLFLSFLATWLGFTYIVDFLQAAHAGNVDIASIIITCIAAWFCGVFDNRVLALRFELRHREAGTIQDVRDLLKK